ncbi:hypothetical protein ACIG56_32965 [Nocardia fusca]|uniref:hypothetical protein n=1 Tax=Nocardia fusca TaxID=941183 RepID=UPI0037CBB7A8
MSRFFRNAPSRRSFRSHAAATVAVLACAAAAAAGCGQAKSETMKVGDCGYFTEGQKNRSWDLQHRACDDPEAALVVVRAAEKTECADFAYSWTSRGTKPKNRVFVCTHLNAQVGDCFNDPQNRVAHLYRLRKVSCTTPGAYQVNTRVDRDEYGVCAGTNAKHKQTVSIVHTQPPVSFCLHRVDA